ncbi:MAG: hypothetical protein KGH94_01555 [Candidatus Micrarchaeota archaeon]|nr:hypothetical protein [Candidatus Micrarchaeota archaeon]
MLTTRAHTLGARTEEMITRQVLASLMRGRDPSLTTELPTVRKGETSQHIQPDRIIPVDMPSDQRVKVKIRKGKIDAFDWTRVQILSESGLEVRW